MEVNDLDLTISRLGECRIPSPMMGNQFVSDSDTVLYHSDQRKIKELLGRAKICRALRWPARGIRSTLIPQN